MGKRLGFVLVCLLFSIGIAVAQNTVSGTVLGDDGLPVIGATVMVKGTKTGTATDIDGILVLVQRRLILSWSSPT